MTWCVKLIFIFAFNSLCVFALDCRLSLKDDFPTPQPIYIKKGGYLTPNSNNGNFVLRRAESITVACPGPRKSIVLNGNKVDSDSMKATCVGGKTFRVDQWEGSFRNITCSGHPFFETDRTAEKCFGNNHIYRVGYRIDGTFYKLYDLCFDNSTMSTLYTSHSIDPTNVYLQTGIPRPQFKENGMYNDAAVGDLYKDKSQKDRFRKILGNGADEKYFSKKNFLSRGHLAPRADFTLYGTQRVSFQYANVAPQWSRGNGGDWAALEDALRRRVKRLGKTVNLYTGVSEVLSLPDEHGVDKELYMMDDANNNPVLPVPLYFYKVIHDPEDRSATAFVSINSPFYSKTKLNNLIFCNDICHDGKLTWLKWRDNDNTTSFCCTYQDFKQTVKHLNLDVVKEFY